MKKQKGIDCEREEKLMKYGPPIYDRLGYEYNPEKMTLGRSWPKKSTMMNGMDRALARTAEDYQRKWEIAFGAETKPADFEWMHFNDRVAQDLDIPYHKVEPCDVEIWKAKGFKVKIEDYQHSSISKEEWDRVVEITGGSALRK